MEYETKPGVMSETITIDSRIRGNDKESKEAKYKSLLPQIFELVKDERDITTSLAQVCAALKYSMDGFFWVGFYFRRGDELVLGPFQGPVACSRIKIPQGSSSEPAKGAGEVLAQAGVCATSVIQKQTIIVDDVNKFPGHIACSSQTKSEIVIPVVYKNIVIAVLDVDSESYSNFDEIDKKYLEELCVLVAEIMGIPHP
jgi:GAF domain-containing protein